MRKQLFAVLLIAVFLAGCSDVTGIGEVSRQSQIARSNEALATVDVAQAQSAADIQVEAIRNQAMVETAQIRAATERSQSTQDFALATQAQAMYREASLQQSDKLLIYFLAASLVVLSGLVAFLALRRQVVFVPVDSANMLPKQSRPVAYLPPVDAWDAAQKGRQRVEVFFLEDRQRNR